MKLTKLEIECLTLARDTQSPYKLDHANKASRTRWRKMMNGLEMRALLIRVAGKAVPQISAAGRLALDGK